MRKYLLIAMLFCCIGIHAQKSEIIRYPIYAAFNMNIAGGELKKINGWHFEVPFATIGAGLSLYQIGSKYYTTDIHGNLSGGWAANLYRMANIHVAANAPLKYARPSIGINLTIVPDALAGENQIWLNDGPFPEQYYESGLKNCYVGLYVGVTSAIPASPVQFGFNIITFNDQLASVCTLNKVSFGWNAGIDLGWFRYRRMTK